MNLVFVRKKNENNLKTLIFVFHFRYTCTDRNKKKVLKKLMGQTYISLLLSIYVHKKYCLLILSLHFSTTGKREREGGLWFQ